MNEANTMADITGQDDETAFPRDPQCPSPAPSAFEDLKRAIQADPAHAWGWHCNIAMPIFDNAHGVLTQRGANEFAADVMQHLFDVDMRASNEWRITEPNWGVGFAPNGEG